MPIRSCWLIVLSSSFISLMIFSLMVLSSVERGILTSLTLIVDLSISSFGSINFFFTYSVALPFCAYTLALLCLLAGLALLHYIMPLYVSQFFFCSKDDLL